MKRLLTISALLLFSVDVFADDEYCYVAGDRYEVQAQVKKNCKKDDVVFASVKGSVTYGTYVLNELAVLFCDFDSQIIINSDNSDFTTTYLLCVIDSNEKRTDK